MTRHFNNKAFTTIEILVVVGVIFTLMAIALPVAGVLRQQARTTQAKTMISQITHALETYAQLIHGKGRYPLHTELYVNKAPEQIDIGITPIPPSLPQGILGLLEIHRLYSSDGAVKQNGSLTDPWGAAYVYRLTRPTPTENPHILNNWNWDTSLSREKRWNDSTKKPMPFPYVYSLGRKSSPTNAKEWVYVQQ